MGVKNKMDRSLKYYYENRDIINKKRRLNYSLQKGKITRPQFDLEVQKIYNNIRDSNIDKDRLNDIFRILDECTYNELLIVGEHIKRKKEYL